MKTLALMLALGATVALAGTDVVDGTTSWELHDLDNGNKLVDGKWPPDLASCHARILDLTKGATVTKRYACVMRLNVDAVPNCDGVEAPPFPIKVVDGMLEAPAIHIPVATDGTWLPMEMAQFVHNPGWPHGFPNCWVMGWGPPWDWKPAETAQVDEPVTWPADLQAKWDASCAERHLHHVIYPEDTCA